MKKQFIFSVVLLCQPLLAQVVLEANGPGNTYNEITAVLAPNYSPIEVPDCNHSSFGDHIDEVYDADFSDYVFRFFIHVTPDNDRCLKFDRQRNEIKSYDKSAANLLGIEGEKVIYKWAFKLPSGFQSSSSFTHIHQLKSVGGSYSSMPMYTLTTRKSSPDRLELRYAETDTQITLKQTALSPMVGVWVEVTEQIEYSTTGFYSIKLINKATGAELFYYDNSEASAPKINWRPGGSFVRPKWGIYRSLNSPDDLRNEEVRFANFSVQEVSSLNSTDVQKQSLRFYPNPASDTLYSPDYVAILEILDVSGRIVAQSNTNTIQLGQLSNALYFVRAFDINGNLIGVDKILKQHHN